MRSRRLVALAGYLLLLFSLAGAVRPSELARRVRLVVRDSGKDLALRRLDGSSAAFDRKYFFFLESARRRLPAGDAGRRGFGAPRDGGASQPRAVRVRAAARARGSATRIPEGWVLAVYGAEAPDGWRPCRVRRGRRALRARAMTGLFPSLAAVAGILLAAGAVGFFAAGMLAPAGRPGERVAWGFLLGLLLLAGFVPIALAVGGRAGVARLCGGRDSRCSRPRARRGGRPAPKRRREGRTRGHAGIVSSCARRWPAACFSISCAR